jgi:hypothetical protein
MSYLTADNLLLDRLRGIVEPVEFRDPDGKVLGRYTPAVRPHVAAMYEKAKAFFGPEELEEAERAIAAERGQGRLLDEILQYLQVTQKEHGYGTTCNASSGGQ